MAIDVSVGQPATIVVELIHRNLLDQAEEVAFMSSDPAVADFGGETDDANPLDEPPLFLAPGTATLAVKPPGPALVSDKINVHPEGVFSGTVQIVLTEQT